MAVINIENFINAPIEVCFDLARSIDLHIDSAHKTKEKAIAGVMSGLIILNDTVTWQARHFGVRQKLKVKISKFERPHHFQDTQIKGIFKYFVHDHFFISENSGTIMKDRFEFECPLGVLGKIAQPVVYNHLKTFLIERNEVIKTVAESGEYHKYL